MAEANTINDYIDIIRCCTKEGLGGCRENARYYYRGEPEDYGDTAGQPGIARGEWLKGNRESDLFYECERRLPEEFARCRSTFEKLVVMQHYGIPTRLVDISLDPLTALFFALYLDPLRHGPRDKDAAVLVYEIPMQDICMYTSDKVSVVANIAAYRYDDLAIAPLSGNVDSFNANDSIHHLLHQIRAEKPHFRDEIIKDHLSGVYCVHPRLDNPRIKA